MKSGGHNDRPISFIAWDQTPAQGSGAPLVSM